MMSGTAIRTIRTLLLGALALAVASPALATSPGPTTRSGLLFDAAAGQCVNSPDPNFPITCTGDAQCDFANAGPCTVNESPIVVRAVLTVTVDHDANDWNDTQAVGYTDVTNSFGVTYVVPDDDGATSRMAVTLEFTYDNQHVILSEIYDLGPWSPGFLSADCPVFCVPEWREPATEIRFSGAATTGSGGNAPRPGSGGGGGLGGGGGASAGPTGLRITLGRPGAEMSAAIVSALGFPAGSVPYLSVVDTVGIWDHSTAGDTIGTTHRMKVNITTFVPTP